MSTSVIENPFNGREDERDCHCNNCGGKFKEGQIEIKGEEEYCPCCGLPGCIEDGDPKDDTKTGWWKVHFEVTLEGEEFRFIDLSEVSQKHILEKIAEGYNQGEIVESIVDGEESDNEEETA